MESENSDDKILYGGYITPFSEFEYLEIKDEICDYVKKVISKKANDVDNKTESELKSKFKNCIAEDVFKLFKKDASTRMVKIINLEKYCKFIEKANNVRNDLFENLYDKIENEHICTVLSKIYDSGAFVHNDYSQRYVNTEKSFKKSMDRKVVDMHYNNKFEFDSLYSVKIDLNDFYGSIYTHIFERLVDKENKKNKNKHFEYYYYEEFNDSAKEFIKYLDKYNREIKNLETNGIITGCYSSHISHEILLVHIDYEICKMLKSKFADYKITYTRYVDDYTFHFNSEFIKTQLLVELSNIFDIYYLKINNFKTIEKPLSIMYCDINYFEIIELVDKIDEFLEEYCKFYIKTKNQINEEYEEEEEDEIIKDENKQLIENELMLFDRFKRYYISVQKRLDEGDFDSAKVMLQRFFKVLNKYNELGDYKDEYKAILVKLGLEKNHWLFLSRVMILYPYMGDMCIDHMFKMKNNNHIGYFSNEIELYEKEIKEKYKDNILTRIMDYYEIFN